jgi:hypothetical protein
LAGAGLNPVFEESAMIDLPHLCERDYSTLTNGLATAADKFDENVLLLRGEAEKGDVSVEQCAALNALARQFARQAEQTHALLTKIEDHVDGA